MNKFRHVQDPRKHLRHQQMQLISVLDKCTQILREDRIYIRNRIKQSDEEVLSFFRPLKHISKGVSYKDMQQLQINLRKYLNQVKATMKMQQLIKFKENYLDGGFQCEGRGDRSRGGNAGMQGVQSKSKQKDASMREITNVAIPMEKWKPLQTGMRQGRCQSLTNLPKPKPTTDIKKSTNRSSQKKLPCPSKLQGESIINHSMQHSTSKKTILPKPPNSSFRHNRTNSSHDNRPRRQQPKIQHQSAGKKPTDNSNIYSHHWATNITSVYHEPEHYRFSQERNQSMPNTHTQGNQKRYRGATYDDLFTPPELLMECRKYIEKTRQPLPRLSAEDLPSNAYKFLKVSGEGGQGQWRAVVEAEQIRQPEPVVTLPQPIPRISVIPPPIQPVSLPSSFPTSQTKVPQQISPIHEQFINSPGDGTIEIIQINLDSKTQTQRNATSKQQDPTQQPLPNLSQYFCQDLIDILFYNRDGAHLKASDYAYTVYSNFAETQPFQKAFQLADTDKDNRVSVDELCSVLTKITKPKNNAVREFFNLIDLDCVGRVTKDQYRRFLEQISESQQAEFEKVRKSAEKIFQYGDYAQIGCITYWGVYLIKSTWEFQEFSSYLEQFQFSIEP